MGRRNSKRRLNRRDAGLKSVVKPTPIGIVSATAAVGSITIVFNQPVSLNGIPKYPDNNGAMPTAASLTNPTTLVLTYGLGPEATGITVPAEEPAIRNASGGFVSPTSVDV
jgi:hypothetical protein